MTAMQRVAIRVPKWIAEALSDKTPDQIRDIIYRGITTLNHERLQQVKEPELPLLQRAHNLIAGPRKQDYGETHQNFSQIAMLWHGVLAHKLQPDQKIIPEDVALLMIQLKVARLAKFPAHDDSILDIAGYAGCYDVVKKTRSEQGVDKLLGATVDYGDENFCQSTS